MLSSQSPPPPASAAAAANHQEREVAEAEAEGDHEQGDHEQGEAPSAAEENHHEEGATTEAEEGSASVAKSAAAAASTAEDVNAPSPATAAQNHHGEGGSVSPSHSQPSTTHELNSSEQHSQHSQNRNDTIESDEPTDFSMLDQTSDHNGPLGLSSNIELHPQNEVLSSSSRQQQQFIKRPLNAYMIWTRQERRKILSSDPKLKMNEVSKAVQMGVAWKNMSDAQKKPYFEQAKRFALEHKQALQEHPELAYAPSKKKGPKAGSVTPAPPEKHIPPPTHSKNHTSGGGGHSSGTPVNSTPFTATPDPSPRSTTPRQILQAQGLPQNAMFFQSPLAPGMQIAQVLGVRPGTQLMTTNSPWGAGMHSTPPATPVTGSLLVQQQQPGGAFVQPHQLQQHQQRIAAASALGVQQVQRAPGSTAGTTMSTPGQMLDLYYTSLCQPAFQNITEAPVNTLSMYPPYLLEQYNQFSQQQQQQSGGNNANNNGGGGGHF